MEKHKCKLCSRSFANGRALGGHMKAHLATLPLPPKPAAAALTQQQLGGADHHEESESSTYSSSSSGEEQEAKNQEVLLEVKSLVSYGLRENPKRSFRVADPEFSFAADAGSSVVQDRESETESSRNPTRRRSKRTRKSGFGESQSQKRSLEEDDDVNNNNNNNKVMTFKTPSWTESSQAEPEPVSSVSDTSTEEDVAMCLMMLSRDVWMPNNQEQEEHVLLVPKTPVEVLDESVELKKPSKIRGGKFRCEKCKKLFRSSRALSGHKKICCLNAEQVRNAGGEDRIFECPYCFKVFGSGQALGGHKRSHLVLGSTAPTTNATTAVAAAESSAKVENNLIDLDLNLPAPMEDDEFSAVSDA